MPDGAGGAAIGIPLIPDPAQAPGAADRGNDGGRDHPHNFLNPGLHASTFVREVKADMPDTDAVIRELNHRINNNFQIIVSLLSLKKRTVAPDRRGDLRFIEEHVHALSVAHRLVYMSAQMVDVPLSALVMDVLLGLRQIANLNDDQLRVEFTGGEGAVGLDQGIALALYLAVMLPPYLDHAIAAPGTVLVTSNIEQDVVTLTVRGTWGDPIATDPLRGHLMKAFGAQLNADVAQPVTPTGQQIRFKLDPPGSAVLGRIRHEVSGS